MRLFAALKPSHKTLRSFRRMQKGVSGARWSDEEKLHITLAFYGDVSLDHAEILDHALGDIRQPGFDLSYQGVGHFGKSRPHSLHVGVVPSEPLMKLHRACLKAARRAEIDMERRNYSPHVTLAYIRGEPRIDRIKAWEKNYNGFKSKADLMDEFCLYSSWPRQRGGNLYRLEASYPLRGALI
jgi:2'-5' RNA ligase